MNASAQIRQLIGLKIKAEERAERLERGPGGIMEMKQTIADKEAEIERLRVHYDGAVMYGNRLVDLIEWAWDNGIDIPAEVFNPCVIAIEHFRSERKRLRDEQGGV